jgi:hypothetical protein
MDARTALKEVINRLQHGENRSFNFTHMEGCLVLREGISGYVYHVYEQHEPTLLHICNPIQTYKQMVKGKSLHPYVGSVDLDARECRRCKRLAPKHITERVAILKKIYNVPSL